MTTRLVIVDDQEVVREGLRAILGTVPGFEVVDVASNGAAGLEAVASCPAPSEEHEPSFFSSTSIK